MVNRPAAVSLLAFSLALGPLIPASADEPESDTVPFILIDVEPVPGGAGPEPPSGEASGEQPRPPSGPSDQPATRERGLPVYRLPAFDRNWAPLESQGERRPVAYAYNVDKTEAAESFEALMEGLRPTLESASQEIGGYQVDTVEMHVIFTAEAGFRLIADAGVEGGVKLIFKRAPSSQGNDAAVD